MNLVFGEQRDVSVNISPEFSRKDRISGFIKW